MIESSVMPRRFAPLDSGNFTRESLIKDRVPCASSYITLIDGETTVGKIEIYSTPLGTMVNAMLFALPFSGDGYEPCFIEIDGKRKLHSSSPCYRVKTANLPPVCTKLGKGEVSFMTDRFSASDVIGKQITFRKNGNVIASGIILGAGASDKIDKNSKQLYNYSK